MDKATDLIPWGGEYALWASDFAWKNRWTVSWMEKHDLIQEFAMVFVKCQSALDETRVTRGGTVGREKVLMKMFQTGCRRRMTDIARSHVIVRNHPDMVRPVEVPRTCFEDHNGRCMLPETASTPPWIDAELAEAISDAPENVRVYLTQCVLNSDEQMSRKEIETIVGVPWARLKKQLTFWADRRMNLLQNPAMAY